MQAFARFLAAAVVLTAAAAVSPAQKIGKPAPEINAPNYFGSEEHISLAKYKGRVLVLVFWRTTDPASIDAIATLNAIHKKLAKSGVVIIAHTTEDREKVESVSKGKQIQYTVAYGGDLDKVYNVSSFPQVFIVDPQSVLVWRGHPADDLEERIKKVLDKHGLGASNVQTLKRRLSAAQQALEKNEPARAYSLAKSVSDVAEKDSQPAQQAKGIMNKAVEAADKQLAKFREVAVASRDDESIRVVAEISVRMAGSDPAKTADNEISKLRSESKTKAKIKTALDTAKGELRMDEAADLESLKQFSAALSAYKEVTEKYPDTDAAKKAKEAIDRINSDKSVQREIAEAREREKADRLLDLADRLARVEIFDMARTMYERVIAEHPGSDAARKAKARLESLPEPEKT